MLRSRNTQPCSEKPRRLLNTAIIRSIAVAAAAVEPAELEFSLPKGTPGSRYDNNTVEKVIVYSSCSRFDLD
jgi:hypothetical protein